jgi:MmyB-like transcription regulator ligand binding domain
VVAVDTPRTALSPEFAELWARHEVAAPQLRVRRFLLPDIGRVTFSVTELEIPAAPGLRIAVSSPHDDETRQKLRAVRRAAPGRDPQPG